MLPAAVVEGTKITPILSMKSVLIDNIGYPKEVFNSNRWPASKLAAIGIYPMIRALAPKTYFEAGANLSYTFAAGVVTETRVDTRMSLAKAKRVKLANINGQLDNALRLLVANYSQLVRETWPTQDLEAYAYIRDNAAATPFLSRMALKRGISVAALVTKVRNKINANRDASGDLIGAAQKQQDAVKAATNFTELRLV